MFDKTTILKHYFCHSTFQSETGTGNGFHPSVGRLPLRHAYRRKKVYLLPSSEFAF